MGVHYVKDETARMQRVRERAWHQLRAWHIRLSVTPTSHADATQLLEQLDADLQALARRVRIELTIALREGGDDVETD